MPDLQKIKAVASDETRIELKKYDFLLDLRMKARNFIVDVQDEKKIELSDLKKELDVIEKIYETSDWESAALRGYIPKQLQKDIKKIEDEIGVNLAELEKIYDDTKI